MAERRVLERLLAGREPERLLAGREPERLLEERALGARGLLGARELLERALPEREDGRDVPEAAR